MSVPLRVARERVRNRIRDFDAEMPAFDSIEIDMAICERYLSILGRLPAADLEFASALTLSAASLGEFSLSTTAPTGYTGNSATAEFRPDVRIRLRSTGEYLAKKTREVVDSFRTGATVATGRPRIFCLWEDKSQVVRGRVYPAPQSDEACDLWVTLAPDDLRDYIGSSSDDADDVPLLLSRFAVNALIAETSADLLKRMRTEDAERRRINVGVADGWMAEAARDLYKEEARLSDLSSSGEYERWLPQA